MAEPALFKRPDSRFFHKKNVERARVCFEKNGAIVMVSFLPIGLELLKVSGDRKPNGVVVAEQGEGDK